MTNKLDKLVEDRQKTTDQIARLEDQLKVQNQKITDELLGQGLTSYKNNKYSTTYQTPKRTIFDWDGLKNSIGAIKFKDLCDLVPSKDKLADAVARGKISPVLAAQFQSQQDMATKITVRENK